MFGNSEILTSSDEVRTEIATVVCPSSEYSEAGSYLEDHGT